MHCMQEQRGKSTLPPVATLRPRMFVASGQKRMTQVLYRGTLDVAFGGVAKDRWHRFVCVVAYTLYLRHGITVGRLVVGR